MNLIIFFSHLITCVLYMDFFRHLLPIKEHSPHFLLSSLIYYIFAVIIGDYFFYNATLLKPIVNYLINLCYLNCFFEGAITKKLTIDLISILLAMLAEIIMMFSFYIIFAQNHLLGSGFSLMINSFHCHLLILVLYRICIIFFRKITINIQCTRKIYILLFIYFSVFVYIYANHFDGLYDVCVLNHSAGYHQIQRLIFYLMMMISPLMILKMSKQLFQLEEDITREILMQKVTKEYEQQLKNIFSVQDKERFLRHELINHIETFQRLEKLR